MRSSTRCFLVSLLLTESFSLAKEDERLYQILNAEQGGWPAPFVSAPFSPGEEVYCHVDVVSCNSGDGVDHLFDDRHLWCDVLEGNTAKDEMDLVRLECEDTAEEGLALPARCCERFQSGDTALYATPKGLVHYATFGDSPRTVVIGMKTMEETYEEALRERLAAEQPMLLYYRNDDDPYSDYSNVPLRLKQSSQSLASIPRTLLKSQTDIVEGKWDAAVLAKELGLNVKGGPFPITYFSYEQALESTEDDSAQFFLKPAWDSWGRGIEVKTRAELKELLENGADEDVEEDGLIIQEAVTDLKLIGGCRFDIRFYILVHDGRVYFHDTGIATWPGIPFDASSPQQATDFAQKYLEEYDEKNDLINTFLTSESTGEGKRWLDAIYRQVVASVPFLTPIVRATKASDKLYQIFGGDAMIRENGDAVITEYNDYPWIDWGHGYVTSIDDNGNEAAGDRSYTKGQALYEEAVSTMLSDFFSIVLGLADTSSPTSTDAESCPSNYSYILDGRVREAPPLTAAQTTELG